MAVISITCSAWYLVKSAHPMILTGNHQTLSASIDTLVTELSVQQFDVEGHLTHDLETPMMQHNPTQNTHTLTAPHIMVSELNQAPWEIHADMATAFDGGQHITFNHHVVVHQHKHQTAEETTLTTEEITYFPRDKLATTLSEVTLKQANNRMHSTGMKAYLAENRVQLLSNARGHYEPNHG